MAKRVTGSDDIAGSGSPQTDVNAVGCTVGIPFVEFLAAGTSRELSRCGTPARIGIRNGPTRRMALDQGSFPWLWNVCVQAFTGSSLFLAVGILANENSCLLLVLVASAAFVPGDRRSPGK